MKIKNVKITEYSAYRLKMAKCTAGHGFVNLFKPFQNTADTGGTELTEVKMWSNWTGHKLICL